MSVYTRFALAARGIALHHTSPGPLQLERADLERASRIIALKEAEHRPLMRRMFPDWEERVEYWHVHDLDVAAPDSAIPLLEQQTLDVLEDVARLSPQPAAPAVEHED